MSTKKPSLAWDRLFLLTFVSAYLFVFNEWLFAITKPSFINELGFPRQLEIFLTLGSLLAAAGYLALLPLVVLSHLPPLRNYKDLLIRLGGLLPAGIFATLVLFLINNFTYTVFKFGIVSSEGWTRGLYGLGFVLLIVLCSWRVQINLVRLSQKKKILGAAPKWILSLQAAILLLSLAVFAPPGRTRASSFNFGGPAVDLQRPHIVLITGDAVEAAHMSLYGYERETTPRIEELAASSLIAENAFANSAKTSGSVMSIYTGKYPANSGVLFPPDVLHGEAAYQHLPGLLRAQGYKTVQITTPYYLDARDFNLLDGFDEVKTSGTLHSKYLNSLSKVLPNDKALFIDSTFNRVFDHLRHIFYIEKMNNPYLLVAERGGQVKSLEDIERMEYLKDEIRSARGPLFIHVHLMVTHGPKYKPPVQVYSMGQSIISQGLWTPDLYDDSILDFDKSIGELVDTLTALDILDNTVIIIGSDHGQIWNPVKRLPLLIRFPHGEYAGRIQANVQNLDIAPTLLDYMGLEPPGWMQGKSLIAGELEQRPIFALSRVDLEDLPLDDEKLILLDSDNLYASTLVYCQQWYKIDYFSRTWDTGSVDGSTTVCPSDTGLTDDQAYQLIEEHLGENRYMISPLD